MWVVKFRHNSQHERLVVNEYLTSCLARHIGLTVPDFSLIRATGDAMSHALNTPHRIDARNCHTVHFASHFQGGFFPGVTQDSLTPDEVGKLENVSEIAGVYLLDLWLANADVRQAIFVRQLRRRRHRAYWIDHGHCFGMCTWRLSSNRVRLNRSLALNALCDVDFQPWLMAIERCSDQIVESYARTLPDEWTAAEGNALTRLLDQIKERRDRIRDLLLGSFNHTVSA
jgi:hypothetical protein